MPLLTRADVIRSWDVLIR